MINKDINIVANDIFELSENSIYNVLEKFSTTQTIDKSLTYVFIKAFYIHVVELCIVKYKINTNFEEIYTNYKLCLETYYKKNNYQISKDLLEDILSAFDNSFNLIKSLNFDDIEDGYEFRHHIINSFELLRLILETKSHSKIRVDLFENYISQFYKDSEKIIDYIIK